MLGSSLRCLLFAGLCLSDPSDFVQKQFVIEDEGSPVLRRFNVTSPAQLGKTLSKALVRASCDRGSQLKISLALDPRPRCLACHPGPRRYLLPFQCHPITHQAAIRRLPGARLWVQSHSQYIGLEYVVLDLGLPFFVPPASRDPGLHL